MSEGIPRLVVCTSIGEAGDPKPVAAAIAVAATRLGGGEDPGPVIVADVRAEPRRPRGTVLASDAARALERSFSQADGIRAAARGRVCFAVADGIEPPAATAVLIDPTNAARAAFVVCDPGDFRTLLELDAGVPRSVLVRAARSDGPVIALLGAETRGRGIPFKAWTRPVGPVAVRRALAGIAAGGQTGIRAERLRGPLVGDARSSRRGWRMPFPPGGGRVARERGQALPAVLGIALLIISLAVILAAIGGAATAKGRLQRGVDLAAISGARSMRDDFPRLFVPATLPSGAPNAAHLSRSEYLDRARSAALEAARRNELDPRSVAATFPGGTSIAPMRIRVRARVGFEVGQDGSRGRTSASAEAEISVTAPVTGGGPPELAQGGGYSGPLAYRQGEPMRPDVAAAFDAMESAARAAGVALVINSAYRSDAEQQRLWDANPDPRWVAPPGTSLHRCGTELDLGSSAAYDWLAANADRYGFVQRYSWEPWHYGFADGPAPCSAEGNSVGSARGDGRAAGSGGLPAFVPERYREPLLGAAGRHGVSAALLAAQIMAESSFDPNAVSAAGAQGIAQFMPATAASYGLGDPFDPVAAIDAQARLMAELLRQFGSVELALAAYNAGPGAVSACDCVPPYPETQAYVARILALLDDAGAGLLGGPPLLDVRLVG